MNAVQQVPPTLADLNAPLLQVRGLTRLYGPDKGCQEVDFDLYPGEVLGIVGESGSGKSTLLSLLSGRCTPDRGGDLWRFDSADSAAVAENITGLGDPGNYGIRGLISLDDGTALIVGMTNPFNLRPGGGWELRRLSLTPAD